jgi:hypothetical protein
MYNYKETPEPVTRACDVPGCAASGEHRAPKSREERPEYYWFCLDHVREYNLKWNYFDGMSQEEIENFQKDALLGHRPTWNYQTKGTVSEEHLREQLRRFMAGFSGIVPPVPEVPPLPAKYRTALEVLSLEHPATEKTIKARYKLLVKQYHPDVNQGDAAAEERFKSITHAYRLLLREYIL